MSLENNNKCIIYTYNPHPPSPPPSRKKMKEDEQHSSKQKYKIHKFTATVKTQNMRYDDERKMK